MFEKVNENWEGVPEPYTRKTLITTVSLEDLITEQNRDSIHRFFTCCYAPTYTKNIHLRATKGDSSPGAIKWVQLTEVIPGDFGNAILDSHDHELYPSRYFERQSKDAMILLRKEIQTYKGRKPSETYCKRHKCKYISESGRCAEPSHAICEALLQIYIKHPEKSSDLIKKIVNSKIIYHPQMAKEVLYCDLSRESETDPSVFFIPDAIQNMAGLLCPAITFATAKLANPIEGNRYVYVATVQTANDITLVLACLLAPFETIKNARQFVKKIKAAFKELLKSLDSVYISGATCGMFEALTEEFGEEACYIGMNNLCSILENMKPDSIRRELADSIPEYLLTPKYFLPPHLKKVLDIMALTKEKDVKEKYNLPLGAFRYIINLRTETYSDLFSKSFDLSTTYSAEIAAEKIASFDCGGSVNTLMTFIANDTRQRITNEWSTCYAGRFSGKFLYDKVPLTPGATERLLHCLMFADNMTWVREADDNYLVEWKATSLIGQMVTKFNRNIPELEGILGCVLPPFGVSTVLSTLGMRKSIKGFLPTSYLVNIELKVCTCGRYQAFQSPCIHALPIILDQKLAVSDYCSERNYLSTAYKAFSRHFEQYSQEVEIR